jgi:predicted transcriptional regulator
VTEVRVDHPTARTELITAFNAGVSQKTLAAEHGLSIRSIDRLVQGTSNRPKATANRLSTVKRILRNHTTNE